MAAIDTTRTHISAPRFGAAFSNIVGTWVTWNDARKTRNTLSKLSNRELADIGLSRGDIEVVVDHGLIR